MLVYILFYVTNLDLNTVYSFLLVPIDLSENYDK